MAEIKNQTETDSSDPPLRKLYGFAGEVLRREVEQNIDRLRLLGVITPEEARDLQDRLSRL